MSNRPDYTVKDTPGPGTYQGRLDGDERLLRKQINENKQAFRAVMKQSKLRKGAAGAYAAQEGSLHLPENDRNELSSWDTAKLGPAPVTSPSIQADKKFSFYKFKNDIMFLEEPVTAGDGVDNVITNLVGSGSLRSQRSPHTEESFGWQVSSQ